MKKSPRSWVAHTATGRAAPLAAGHIVGSYKHLMHDSAVGGILVNFRDITERIRAQEAIRERELQLSHAARISTTGEMAAALAHELNQPLFAIVNFIAGWVYGAHLLQVPERWIGVGLGVRVGLGVLRGAITTRQRDSGS